MLINFDNTRPLHLVGTGVVAEELNRWMATKVNQVAIVDMTEFENLPLGSQCMLSFWNIDYRTKFLTTTQLENYSWPTYIHPRADCYSNNIGPGSVIYPGAFVAYPTTIGAFALIGQHTSIGHGTSLGSNNVVSPATIIGGSTTTGDNIVYGQNSSIKDKITIGSDIKFFMNSIVSKSITKSGSYYGNKRVPDNH
jgi:UDP-3-O-[3-hydroxymyristoyl] glucosamine N-acyltransferase